VKLLSGHCFDALYYIAGSSFFYIKHSCVTCLLSMEQKQRHDNLTIATVVFHLIYNIYYFNTTYNSCKSFNTWQTNANILNHIMCMQYRIQTFICSQISVRTISLNKSHACILTHLINHEQNRNFYGSPGEVPSVLAI